MIAIRVVIEGRVQGVGYRAWVNREAQARGLKGWVRNRADGSVEAVFSGDEAAVRHMIEICRRGPMAAKVRVLTESRTPEEQWPGFEIRATI